jgi:hypothetical protein
MAWPLILNLWGHLLVLDQVNLSNNFIETSVKSWKEDYYGQMPHKLRNDHLEDGCLTLQSALSILCWDSRY